MTNSPTRTDSESGYNKEVVRGVGVSLAALIKFSPTVHKDLGWVRLTKVPVFQGQLVFNFLPVRHFCQSAIIKYGILTGLWFTGNQS